MTTLNRILPALGIALLCTTLPIFANAQETVAPTPEQIAETARAQRECRDGRGEAGECALYAYYLYWGTGTAADDEAAFRIASKACEDGNRDACYTAGNVRYFPNSSPVDWPEALVWWKRGCELSHAQSCIYLGELYRDGEGTEVNGELARKAFSLACANGNGEGCLRAGNIEADALYGVPKNEANAVNSYRAGCALEHMLSCAYVGWMAYYGLGMDADLDLAIRQYRRACAGEEQWGCDRVEEIRAGGEGFTGYAELIAREQLEKAIPTDLPLEQQYLIATAFFQNGNVPLALLAFEDLAAAGLGDANYQLGLIYYDGQGVPQDVQAGIRYFNRAALQLHPYAMFFMAQVYYYGMDTDRNELGGITYMRGAAEAGIAEAEPIWRAWQAAMDTRYEERDARERQMQIENEESQRQADAANMRRIRDLYSSGQNQQDNQQVCGMVYRNNQANQECMARETFDKYYNPAFQ